jgi:N-acetylmuramoyl-L-alanine amidase
MLRLPSVACPPGLARAGIALAAIAAMGVSAASPARSVAPTSSTPLAGKVVAIDAGHNGGNGSHPDEINREVNAGGGRRKACDTTGTETTDRRLSEHAFTFDVAQRLRRQLEAEGARVVMTRTTDTGVGPCIDRRAALGNSADAAVSIHADGGPPSGRGFHVIRPKGVTGQSRSLLAKSDLLGRRVRTALRAKGYRPATYIGTGGLDLRDDLGGLNLSTVPKVLVELGNMRNTDDARLMKRPVQRERMAAALADALARQLADS